MVRGPAWKRHRHNTEYRPSPASTLRASNAREKTDKIVTLYPREGGQIRPARRSELSGEGGQICPPNPEKEIIKPNPRADTPPRVETRRAVPLVFVPETKADQVKRWRVWLRRHGLPSIEALGLRTMKAGKPGYALPGYWPPDEANPSAHDWIAFFSRRHVHIADENRPSKDVLTAVGVEGGKAPSVTRRAVKRESHDRRPSDPSSTCPERVAILQKANSPSFNKRIAV